MVMSVSMNMTMPCMVYKLYLCIFIVRVGETVFCPYVPHRKCREARQAAVKGNTKKLNKQLFKVTHMLVGQHLCT